MVKIVVPTWGSLEESGMEEYSWTECKLDLKSSNRSHYIIDIRIEKKVFTGFVW
ncbi:hypothetical protein P872_10975 [Rhodonellum psychrophilum GCM71 = DSM 17998]|uniref:Uncharacterized protein n=1 Tax=Rhodonellum psychrophilum GCM71 = DSM 17998 TaxID=1123057 RepID=U5BTW2_9BACT|nr:hypothetical protein P872_10975 [Rhodonellum psychrophilum GCM71 = DSM 17998]